jgi:hypothetical protein
MNTPIVVRLTPHNAELADKVGLMRMRSSGNTGRNPHRSQEGRTDEHRRWHERLGCMAEAAVAQHLGIPYAGTVNTFHAEPDVGVFDVRATDRPDGRLILRDNDPADYPYVLAVCDGHLPVVRLVGWLYGWEGRQRRWLRNPHGRRPCWMVPQSELHPVPPGVR